LKTFFIYFNLFIKTLHEEGIKSLSKKIKKRLYCDNYKEWVKRYEANNKFYAEYVLNFKSADNAPLISVIMPVFNTQLPFLKMAIESVRNQIYPHWELCVADDASTDPKIKKILRDYQQLDKRIKVTFRNRNGGISVASNSALSLAEGQWLALFDHDDILPKNALLEVAQVILRNPHVRLIYSDEDKITKKGIRISPYFKPDWNLALLRSHNLITHLGVYHADTVKEIGGFRVGLEGAQDYDLALRLIEKLTPEQIFHIPKILYHWRIHPQSTADISANAKPYAMLNGERALNEHLQRVGTKARAELIGHGYRVHYELPLPRPRATLIILTRDKRDLLKRCIESILQKTEYSNYEILVVDNSSKELETFDYFADLEGRQVARIIRDDGDFNFSRLNNLGVRSATGEILVLMNNDLEVIDNCWLAEMVSLAIQPEAGAVGAKLLYPDGRIQHGGVILGIGGWAGHAHKGFPRRSLGYAGRLSLVSEFSAVTGACLALRKELFEKVGGFDEVELAVACNDVDLCLRLRKMGYRNVWTPNAKLYHHESASRGYEDTPDKKARFEAEKAVMMRRWGKQLQVDPAYNPNLTLDTEDFGLAWPPRVG
jgi:GT2 family glycosyltransferase